MNYQTETPYHIRAAAILKEILESPKYINLRMTVPLFENQYTICFSQTKQINRKGLVFQPFFGLAEVNIEDVTNSDGSRELNPSSITKVLINQLEEVAKTYKLNPLSLIKTRDWIFNGAR